MKYIHILGTKKQQTIPPLRGSTKLLFINKAQHDKRWDNPLTFALYFLYNDFKTIITTSERWTQPLNMFLPGVSTARNK